MTHSLDGIVQKTRRYWYEDGFVEIATGALFVVVATMLAIDELVPHDSPWFPIMMVGWPVLIIAAAIPIKGFVNRLKERVTYPRTGYVAYGHERTRSRFLVAGVAMAAAVIILLGGRWLNSIPAVGGLVMGAAYASLGLRLGGWRWYALGALALAIGLGVALLTPLSEPWGMSVLMAGMGIGTISSGLLVLRGYLRQTTPAQEG